jgi:steroid delta-isomerase
MRSPCGVRSTGLILALLLAASPARADDATDIRARFEQWTDDFNAKRGGAICDLFSKDLISTVRGQGEADYATRCDIITRSLADPARGFHYQLDLHEVIVEGNLAVARRTWTLFVTPLNVTVVEHGIDVLRKEADGQWRIVRFVSYEGES